MREGVACEVRETNLVARVDDDVRTAEELCYGARVGVEEPLLDLGHTITTPVDLNKLG